VLSAFRFATLHDWTCFLSLYFISCSVSYMRPNVNESFRSLNSFRFTVS
jgi:hypothetical protein